MLERFGQSLRIGLAREGAGIVRVSGLRRPGLEIVGEQAWRSGGEEGGFDGMGRQLAELLRECQNGCRFARIVLDDRWVRSWMVVPPKNAARRADLEAAACARFQMLYGESPAGWRLTGDWKAGQAFLACAIPLPLLEMLQQVSRERGLRLLEVAPHFVVAWNRWQVVMARDDAWLGVMHLGRLTLMAADRGCIIGVRELTLSGDSGQHQEAFLGLVEREALRLNLALPAEIAVSGHMPSHWVSRTTGRLKFRRLEPAAPAGSGHQLEGMWLAVAGGGNEQRAH
jgi:hypothetical protein